MSNLDMNTWILYFMHFISKLINIKFIKKKIQINNYFDNKIIALKQFNIIKS